jgi:hypothetical protein
MKIIRTLAVLAATALLLASCVAYSPVVGESTAHKPGMGYLTGVFRDQSAPARRLLGISYENVDTLTLHTIAFQKESPSLQVIEVPPGTYRVQGWFMASMFNEVMVRGKPQGVLFTRTFRVAPDTVHFLGEYTGSGTVTTSGTMIYYNAQMRPTRIVPDLGDQKAFADKFPNLGKLPLKAAYL